MLTEADKRYQRSYYRKTAYAKKSGDTWTQHEIDLVMSRRYSDRELSSMLNRSMAAIQIRRSREHKKTA